MTGLLTTSSPENADWRITTTRPKINPGAIRIEERGGEIFLHGCVAIAAADVAASLVTPERLGRTLTPDLPFENPDGSPLALTTDYFGVEREAKRAGCGPFAKGARTKIWPR